MAARDMPGAKEVRESLQQYSSTLDHMTKETMGGLVPGDGRKGYTAYAFMQIRIGGKNAGVIKFGLFGGIVPVTVANFIGLLIHQKGYGYRGSTFHRIIKWGPRPRLAPWGVGGNLPPPPPAGHPRQLAVGEAEACAPGARWAVGVGGWP